ncbi:unnamed protein product [Soboliphyme baturini]|uniref:Uncharacterized protein n=1 Tax=Soboliphyme baturini TaxID=241478 RepID=A0A183IDX1_9BILA|nr:unnamed protein product [Soboliphyme baturini]
MFSGGRLAKKNCARRTSSENMNRKKLVDSFLVLTFRLSTQTTTASTAPAPYCDDSFQKGGEFDRRTATPVALSIQLCQAPPQTPTASVSLDGSRPPTVLPMRLPSPSPYWYSSILPSEKEVLVNEKRLFLSTRLISIDDLFLQPVLFTRWSIMADTFC